MINISDLISLNAIAISLLVIAIVVVSVAWKQQDEDLHKSKQ